MVEGGGSHSYTATAERRRKRLAAVLVTLVCRGSKTLYKTLIKHPDSRWTIWERTGREAISPEWLKVGNVEGYGDAHGPMVVLMEYVFSLFWVPLEYHISSLRDIQTIRPRTKQK